MTAKLPTVHPITEPPGFHWFGYYDKFQVDPSGRFVLGMQVDFEHRSPRSEDIIRIGLIDLQDNNRWTELGTSRAWGWQQGCMLQWLPGSETKVIWNDRFGDHFGCHILDIQTGEKRQLPGPIYTITSDGKTAFFPDFRRIQHCRPGYGYAGIPDPNRDILAPENAGIWRIDLESGEINLIFSLADVVKIPYPHGDFNKATHWFNHLLVNTDDTRLEFLHRWRNPGQTGFDTRMLTIDFEGKNLHVVDDYGYTSHFIWRDPRHILAWAWHPTHKDAFYLYEDRDQLKTADDVEVVGLGIMTVNGHCTYLPGNKWILNDTYPDENNLQHLYLYHISTGKRVELGSFYAPPAYRGEWRCDLHPRATRDGQFVLIDSAHAGTGRQMYIIDIREIIGADIG